MPCDLQDRDGEGQKTQTLEISGGLYEKKNNNMVPCFLFKIFDFTVVPTLEGMPFPKIMCSQ